MSVETPKGGDLDEWCKQHEANRSRNEELSGEIVEAVEVDGQDYYTVVVENEKTGEPERVLVPVGDTEHEPGDEITARHTPQGVEIEEAYGYGR